MKLCVNCRYGLTAVPSPSGYRSKLITCTYGPLPSWVKGTRKVYVIEAENCSTFTPREEPDHAQGGER